MAKDIWILGINGYSAHLPEKEAGHDTGATLIRNGEIVAAVNEERLTREKLERRFPFNSIKEVLTIAGITEKDVDAVAFAEMKPFEQAGAVIDTMLKTFGETGIFQVKKFLKTLHRMRYIRRVPPDGLKRKPLLFVDHHLSHAASAYYTAPYDNVCVISLDGIGDRSICGFVGRGENGRIKPIKYLNGFYSPGIFYSVVTEYLGFRPIRHEGKITGLAAYGDPKKAYKSMEMLISYREGKLDFFSEPDFRILQNFQLGYLKKIWGEYTREEIAAAAQKRLEDVVLPFISDAVKASGRRKLVLAGGVFGNVKLNQRIAEFKEVESVYIHPNMGDGGLSTGAALYFYHSRYRKEDYGQKFLKDVYLGPSFSDDEIEKELEKNGLTYRKTGKIEEEIAEFLVKKKIVGRFSGRMEYGPRALGNRSILADPTDKTINDWLNKRLHRTEFMPFAPSILEEYSDRFYKGWSEDDHTARFMTITYNVNGYGGDIAPAVNHIDNTARPQVVRNEDNPSYWKIIDNYRKLTGIPLVVNTSFNMHEEPIVCTPYDAVRAFLYGSVDILAIGSFIVDADLNSDKIRKDYKI